MQFLSVILNKVPRRKVREAFEEKEEKDQGGDQEAVARIYLIKQLKQHSLSLRLKKGNSLAPLIRRKCLCLNLNETQSHEQAE